MLAQIYPIISINRLYTTLGIWILVVMNETSQPDSDIVSTYERLYSILLTRPSAELVADTTRYPYPLVAERMIDLSLSGRLTSSLPLNNDYSDDELTIAIKRVVECCDSQQQVPTLSIIRNTYTQSSPVMRRAILEYLSVHYTPIDSYAKKILAYYRNTKDRSASRVANALKMPLAMVNNYLATLQSKGLL